MKISMVRKFMLLIACLGLVAGAAVSAQNSHPFLGLRHGDLLKHNNAFMPFAMKNGAPSPVENDTFSFGHRVKFLGLFQTPTVNMAADCSTVTLNPGDTCNTLLPEPQVTTFEQNNLVSFTLPAKSARTIICPVITAFYDFQLQNTTGAALQGFALYNVTLVFSNAALNDPSAINANTGQPFNGTLNYGPVAPVGSGPMLQAGDTDELFGQPTKVGLACVTEGNLQQYGLPANLAKAFFKNPTTITVQVQGIAQLVALGSVIYGVRLLGD